MANKITAQELSEWTSAPTDAAGLTEVVSAVNTFVNALPIVANAEGGEWGDTVHLAALMLAARLLRRRNSPNGIEALTSDQVTYTARYDSDIGRLLCLDGFQKPAVG